MIYILHADFQALGAQRAAIRLANHFVKNGEQVTFVVFFDIGPLISTLSKRVQVYCPTIPLVVSYVPYLATFYRYLSILFFLFSRSAPNLISFTPYMNIICIFYKLFSPHARVICQERSLFSSTYSDKSQMSSLARGLLTLIYNTSYLVPSKWSFLSQEQLDDFCARFPIRPCQRLIIPNSFDPESILARLRHGKSVFLSSPASPQTTFDIVFVGRLTDQKDPFLALNSIYHYMSNFNSNISCAFVGDGYLKPELEARIKSLGIVSNVSVMGYSEYPEVFIKDSRLLLVTSKYEGIPNTYLEAIALGTPIVSTFFLSGPKEILHPIGYPYITRTRNAASIASLIDQCLTYDRNSELMAAAYNHLNQIASLQAVTSAYQTVFH